MPSGRAPPGSDVTATLRVDAPRGAVLRVNRVGVGSGPWSSDTLAPGWYEIVAVVPSIDGCESARQVKTVALIAGGAERVAVRPVACGTLELTGPPPDAMYVVTSLESGKRWAARMSDSPTVVLPEGRYALRVAAPPPCAPFETDSLHSIRIAAGRTERKRVLLICH
jgi:hypothetical protein